MFATKLVFAETGTGLVMVQGLTKYGDAVKTGVFNQTINVHIGSHIFENRRLKSPIMSVDRLLGREKTGTQTMRAFDKVHFQDVLYLPNQTTSQVPGQEGNELSLTMTDGDPSNLTEKVILNLSFAVQDETVYTNEAIVSSKTNSTTIGVKASGYQADGTTPLLIGIASGVPIPAQTLMNLLAPRYSEGDDIVKPVSFHAKPFENYVQEFRWGYQCSFMAAEQNLFGPIMNKYGKKRKELDMDARDILTALIEKSLLFNGKPKKKEVLGENDTEQYGQFGGLIWSITHSTGPAVTKNYGTFNYSTWEQWEWNFSDVDKDPTYKPMIWCNRAFEKWVRDQKVLHTSWTWESVPDNVYGIPFVKYIETDAAKFELGVHPAIHRRYPDMDKPAFVAVTPDMLFIKPFEQFDFILRNNLPTTKTLHLAEYYSVLGAEWHNLNTAYHGVMLPDNG